MDIQQNLRIVVDAPNLLLRIEASTILLEKWQKDEIVREVFDCMESNLNSYTRSLAHGVSIPHLADKPLSPAQISELNNIYMAVGLEFWFKCKELDLFKHEVNENAIAGFIDTFPLFLEFVGPDYVVLTHNDLTHHSVARSIGIV